MKQPNPLQSLIDELHQNKLLHSELAKNAQNDRQSVENGYADFAKGVVHGLELAIEKVANFQFWNDARTNPPKFDKNRAFPNCPKFLCIVSGYDGYSVTQRSYSFKKNDWVFPEDILYWQEYNILPKSLLK